jgi:hypothetical protein
MAFLLMAGDCIVSLMRRGVNIRARGYGWISARLLTILFHQSVQGSMMPEYMKKGFRLKNRKLPGV